MIFCTVARSAFTRWRCASVSAPDFATGRATVDALLRLRNGAQPTRAFALRGGRDDRGLTIDDGLRPSLVVVGSDDGADVELADLRRRRDVADALRDHLLDLRRGSSGMRQAGPGHGGGWRAGSG